MAALIFRLGTVVYLLQHADTRYSEELVYTAIMRVHSCTRAPLPKSTHGLFDYGVFESLPTLQTFSMVRPPTFGHFPAQTSSPPEEDPSIVRELLGDIIFVLQGLRESEWTL